MRIFLTALAAFALAFAALPSWAAITPQQATTLKATCTAAPACLDLMQAADDVGMAAWFNTTEAAYIVWRSDVTSTEARKVMVWTEIDALTAGKTRIWDWMREGGVLDDGEGPLGEPDVSAQGRAVAARLGDQVVVLVVVVEDRLGALGGGRRGALAAAPVVVIVGVGGQEGAVLRDRLEAPGLVPGVGVEPRSG